MPDISYPAFAHTKRYIVLQSLNRAVFGYITKTRRYQTIPDNILVHNFFHVSLDSHITIEHYCTKSFHLDVHTIPFKHHTDNILHYYKASHRWQS